MSPRFFPSLIIVEMIGAAIVYAWYKDWRMAIYWACGAGLNLAITWGKP
jgi:hypothetical protein